MLRGAYTAGWLTVVDRGGSYTDGSMLGGMPIEYYCRPGQSTYNLVSAYNSYSVHSLQFNNLIMDT